MSALYFHRFFQIFLQRLAVQARVLESFVYLVCQLYQLLLESYKLMTKTCHFVSQTTDLLLQIILHSLHVLQEYSVGNFFSHRKNIL